MCTKYLSGKQHRIGISLQTKLILQDHKRGSYSVFFSLSPSRYSSLSSPLCYSLSPSDQVTD
ncbi:MAG: hypothetical protein ACK55Z_27870, partial [bacterium]